ncbi:MAG: homoserine kinase [Campylobacterales bacterium]|nr:homoserine kinase [Campylobacterales bacterium]
MKISVPATSANLGPGFDTLGLALDIRNQVVIKPAKFHSVSLKGEGADNPKLKDNNMFISTFNDFYQNLSTKKQQFRFEFQNEIPLSRGLGSSSAVIISAIASAYAIEGIKIDNRKLLNLALSYESHPDNITPAVNGGFCVATIHENEVYFIKKDIPKTLKAVIVVPNRPISTNLSRKALPFKYSKEDTIFNVSHSSLLTAAFMSEDWRMLKKASKDRMHQYYRMKQMPELFAVQKTALRNGALMSTLSGSGSTFFNIAYYKDAPKLAKKLQEVFPHFKIFTCDFDNDGVIVED